MNSVIERIKLDFKWTIASRGAVVSMLFAFAIESILNPLLIYTIYTQYQIPGWSVNEIIFIYGTVMLIYGIVESFLGAFLWDNESDIISGREDYRLIRPKGLLRQQGISFFLPTSGDIIIGGILVALFNPGGAVLNYLLFVTAGILFMEGIYILSVGLEFKYVTLGYLARITNTLTSATAWPIKIFPHWFKLLLVFFPVVLVGYGPAHAYLYGFTTWLWISFIIGISIFAFSILYLKYAVKNYQSAGG